MVKTVKRTEDVDLVKAYMKRIFRECGSSGDWKSEKEVSFKKGKTVLGSIILDDKTFEVTGDKLQKIFLTIEEDYKKIKKITTEQVAKTPFKNLFSNEGSYRGLTNCPKVFNKMATELTALGVGEVIADKNLTLGQSIFSDRIVLGLEIRPENDSVKKDLPDGYYNRVRQMLLDNYPVGVTSAASVSVGREVNAFRHMEKEKVTAIKLESQHIGNYHPERNFIQLFINPFCVDQLCCLDVVPTAIWNSIMKLLKKLPLKVVSTRNAKQRIFVATFNRQARERLDTIEKHIKDNEKSIESRERDIGRSFASIGALREERIFLTRSLDDNGKTIFSEIDKAKKLPFIKEIDVEGDSIKMVFKPTFIDIKRFFRSSGGKKYGKRSVYLGGLTFNIKPGSFMISSDVKNNSHCHPHVSGSHGSPCFGDGEGKRKIYELLSANKYSELSKMLWFWIKIYRDSGAYEHIQPFYDHALESGLPIWDEKGVRIEINEPDRISSGEQGKLDKNDYYAKQHKMFLDIKKPN